MQGLASLRNPAAREAPEDWRILRLLAIYRLLLVTLLILLFESGYAPNFFDQVSFTLFSRGCAAYGVLALALMAAVLRWRQRPMLQAQLQVLVDIGALGVLVYACGGVGSGVGTLLITPIVAGALVMPMRLAMLQAALATLTMFGLEWLYLQNSAFAASDYTPTGVLGLMLFGACVAAATVAQRARTSEALAARVGSEFEDLSRLNQSIIETLQTGVIVVDAFGRVRTLNAAAQRLLGNEELIGRLLEFEAPLLAARLKMWRIDGDPGNTAVTPRPGAPDVVPHFSRLGGDLRSPVLILLDDTARLREQAQQMKLAALGRLSASIAHEIRNPLSAISHAGQLLLESTAVSDEDRRLLEMIHRHSGRIDRIVKDVLALSRRDTAHPVIVPLKNFLVRSAGLYQEGVHRAQPIELIDVPEKLLVRFDPDHLQQVLFNLWNNAFAHGGRDDLTVMLFAGTDEHGYPWLDICDNGSGIKEDLHERIFEPFFSTTHRGTGLGLYLVRELCEYNQARIAYHPRASGACFRLTFAREPA